MQVHHSRTKRGLMSGRSPSHEIEGDCPNRNRVEITTIVNSAYLITGLITIAQSRSGYIDPIRMEQFTSFPLETSLCRLFDEQSVFNGCSLFFFQTMVQCLVKNISFRDGSATFHCFSKYMGFVPKWLYHTDTL